MQGPDSYPFVENQITDPSGRRGRISLVAGSEEWRNLASNVIMLGGDEKIMLTGRLPIGVREVVLDVAEKMKMNVPEKTTVCALVSKEGNVNVWIYFGDDENLLRVFRIKTDRKVN